MAMHCFRGVAVGFPAGASAYPTKETWQNTSWVLWSTGELRVDGSTFGLVFSPATGGRLTAKPLGCLTGAAPVAPAEPGAARTFVASTNDPVHCLVRLNFDSPADEEAFAALAQAAELASSRSYSSSGGRRSTLCGVGRRSSVGGRPQEEGITEAIAAQVSQQCPGSWPLVFGGVELYGPDPHGESGSEVLLGRGAVVLVDPPIAGRVGSYELLFCEETTAEPCLRLPIGPRTKIAREADDAPSGRGSRLSSAPRRLTLGGGDCGRLSCAQTVFSVALPGAPGWALAFDSETDAAGFERDFTVRQRLVALSLKTSRGWRTVGELQGELQELRRHGLLASLRSLALQALVLAALALMLYAAVIYSQEPERPLLDVAALALQDASATAMAVGERAAEAGSALCSLVSRALPAAAVERCIALPDAVEARSCVSALLSVG